LGEGGKGREGFLKKNSLVPWGYHQISQNVPQDVWNNISNLSHMVCPEFNFHVYKQKRWAVGECAWVQRGSQVGGCPMF